MYNFCTISSGEHLMFCFLFRGQLYDLQWPPKQLLLFNPLKSLGFEWFSVHLWQLPWQPLVSLLEIYQQKFSEAFILSVYWTNLVESMGTSTILRTKNGCHHKMAIKEENSFYWVLGPITKIWQGARQASFCCEINWSIGPAKHVACMNHEER